MALKDFSQKQQMPVMLIFHWLKSVTCTLKEMRKFSLTYKEKRMTIFIHSKLVSVIIRLSCLGNANRCNILYGGM